ncbi:defective in cullin neddylation protein AAR3-like isoform X2 [Telopea speciosissima]|uniref:defective in cullin neddylation protein AAR3-like isoform X2 n=1 Tax=Telopea speciosissima TaxID=54955 RepID=UPI001CC81E09|nr:defective in cullin neddylation protein AAR3-like isoform X2 [Telopea speciosissima]
MDSSVSNPFDIFEIYRRYCDITSGNKHAGSREALAQLLKLVESRVQKSGRSIIFDDLSRLMLQLNFMKNQRHNISEDTWQQVLAFSRCVHEDLEGYDPKGAWPVLIDDFVEHMYRITPSNSCCSLSLGCYCGETEAQACISDDSLHGLKVFAGSKRKSVMEFDQQEDLSNSNSSYLKHSLNSKRSRTSLVDTPTTWEDDPPGNNADDCMEIVKNNNTLGSSSNSQCAVERSLSKGFAGLLSTGSCLKFDQKRSVFYT